MQAAASGDFVVALYNPVSKRRQKHLGRARDIFLSARPPETPVVLARNLGRDGETVDVIPLSELQPKHADMLTLVLVGSTSTRLIRQGPRPKVYTPRGYGDRVGPTEKQAQSGKE